MRRLAAIFLLIGALTPLLWARADVTEPSGPIRLTFTSLDTEAVDAGDLGPFRLKRAWVLKERHDRYGGISGLVARGQGRLLGVTDGGLFLEFSEPEAARPTKPKGGWVLFSSADKYHRDVEAATADLENGKVWVALEFANMIIRHDYRGGRLLHGERVQPPALSSWGNNSGPEALTRLADGRFLVLREGFVSLLDRRRHAGVLFAGDPVDDPEAAQSFTFVGPGGYSPTDAATLPDGRVLVLMRRVIWPMPPRFGGAIAIGDPETIREGREWQVQTLATWQGGLPVDNFEGFAIEPVSKDDKGRELTLWAISDDNRATLQRTVLWKLRLDPADLPPRNKANDKQKGARDVRTPPVSSRPGEAGK